VVGTAEGGIRQRGYRLQTLEERDSRSPGLYRAVTLSPVNSETGSDGPAIMRTVVEFNGPGNNGSEVRDGIAHGTKAGDVVVIPAGTGHCFTRIEDHIDYLMVRIDPDKMTPLKSEAQSRDYLSKPAKKGE
jgi:hypothetical protein